MRFQIFLLKRHADNIDEEWEPISSATRIVTKHGRSSKCFNATYVEKHNKAHSVFYFFENEQ